MKRYPWRDGFYIARSLRFVAESPERTRVELEHRKLERHGEGWEGVRAGVDSSDGWPLYLHRFADLLKP